MIAANQSRWATTSMASLGETAVKVSSGAIGVRAGRQAVELEREAPRARRARRASARLGSGSGSAQSGVGPSTKRSTGAPCGAATSTTTRSMRVRRARDAPNERPDRASVRAERDAARHARLRGERAPGPRRRLWRAARGRDRLRPGRTDCRKWRSRASHAAMMVSLRHWHDLQRQARYRRGSRSSGRRRHRQIAAAPATARSPI